MAEFGDQLMKDNDVGLIVDGKVFNRFDCIYKRSILHCDAANLKKKF